MVLIIHRRIAGLLLSLALLSAACGPADSPPLSEIRLVATTTIMGDLARNIVGDGGVVEVLMPVGVDPHDYRASSQQVAAIQKADLVIANGLSLEEAMGDVLESAQADGANLLMVAPLVDPLPFATDRGVEDPHVWLDPVRMGSAARLIAKELADVEPGIDWMARAEDFAARLSAADEQIVDLLAEIPADRRRLVTNHDALGYFAARYGFEVVGVVIPGGSTLSDPSSAELAELVRVMEEERVPALFAETSEPSALAEAIAAEAGVVTLVELFTGSLGAPGSAADTLIGMLITNAERIAGALTGLRS